MFYCFVDPREIRYNTVRIRNDDFFHLTRVLRCKLGEKIRVRSDRFTYLCEIVCIDKSSLKASVLEKREVPVPDGPRIILAPSLIREKSFDQILQFGVQLGAHEFCPVAADRSVHHAWKPERLVRWQKILLSASMQCQRETPPVINPPVSLEGFSCGKSRSVVMPWELEEEKNISGLDLSGTDEIVIITGPEGGWTREEISRGKEIGFQTVSLGPYILRAETAVLTALVLIKEHLGAFSNVF